MYGTEPAPQACGLQATGYLTGLPAKLRSYVVGPVVGRQGADAPAAEHVRPEHALDHRARVLRIDDAGPQRVRGVGRDAAGKAPIGLAAERVVPLLRQPELAVEARVQVPRLLAQPLGAHAVAVALEQLGHAAPGQVDVALDLGQGDGRLGQLAVLQDDAVARVLPALVPGAAPGPRPVVDEPVAVGVAELVDPGQRATDVVAQLPEQVEAAGPRRVDAEQDEELRRRVDAAEVGRLRDLAQV